MCNDKILEKLQEIFIDIFGDETIIITNYTDASDIEGWDSLAHISILAAVQDEFAVTFSMDEIIEMKNVEDMINSIRGKL